LNISGLIIGQDITTALFATVNAGYFGGYWWRTSATRGRRVGAAALMLVSAASVVEATFSQSLFWSQHDDLLSYGVWALLRFPLLLATLLISAIILRRIVG
jgi:hypothetical protein